MSSSPVKRSSTGFQSGLGRSRTSTASNAALAGPRRTSPSRSPVSSARHCSGLASGRIRSAGTSSASSRTTVSPFGLVERDPGAKTTLAFVTHDETGERAFTFYRDGTADTRLEPGRIDDETLADCEWVHAGGVTLSSGPSRAATLDLLERARPRAVRSRSIRICGRRYGRTWRRSRAWWATRSLTSTSVSRRRRSSRRSVLMVGHRPNTRGQRSKADRSTPSS